MVNGKRVELRLVDYEEHLKPSDRLVIAFAGGPQNVYQFGKTLEQLDCSYVLMRDSTQRYHHYGVQGIGDQGEVGDYIANFWDHYDKYVITIGVSSGAYAALLYGQLGHADEVIAISALTSRQPNGFDPVDHPFIVDPANPDVELLPYFKDGPIPVVKAFISDGPDTRLDRQMIERIGVKPTVVPGFSHGDLARGMRDSGALRELLS
jgi:hypothetical protein